ncbi:galactose-binding lectin-like [Dreissena polymorpha]|uniref:galactose-binding lectin-like n=1 Tax=Dreissena polymorpha TaxID=45954 RepID=UPI0022642693|nr:galactose-binding lectin-like [Dreissena polymorpha]
MSEPFLIKHMSSGRFFHPESGKNNPRDNTEIVLHSDIHAHMRWKFVRVHDNWGYIQHVASGKIIHPLGGSLCSGNETGLVLHNDRHQGAPFSLDACNHHVIHKGGKFAHPQGGSPCAGDGTKVVLHSDVTRYDSS